MPLLSDPLEADMPVSLTSNEITHSFSASLKLQQDEDSFAPFFSPWDNDILNVITHFFVFLREMTNGLLKRLERHWSRNNHKRRYIRKDREGN